MFAPVDYTTIHVSKKEFLDTKKLNIWKTEDWKNAMSSCLIITLKKELPIIKKSDEDLKNIHLTFFFRMLQKGLIYHTRISSEGLGILNSNRERNTIHFTMSYTDGYFMDGLVLLN